LNVPAQSAASTITEPANLFFILISPVRTIACLDGGEVKSLRAESAIAALNSGDNC
jgi:hypothetical protein